MFSQLHFVRLKAAESAVREGRHDDAYRLASAPDLRAHPRAAAVLASLSGEFLNRARSHFRADRFNEALRDLDRAADGGLHREEIAELRNYVLTVTSAMRENDHVRQQQIDAIRRRVEQGSLAAGRDMLQQVSTDHPAIGQLRGDVERRTRDVADLVRQVEQSLAQGRLAEAAARLKKARALDARDEAVLRLETVLCGRAVEAARAALAEGRLARACDELACLEGLGANLPLLRELAQLLTTAREAAAALQADDYGEARRHTMTLARLVPDAPWVRQIVEGLKQLDELRTALLAGPLGEKLRQPMTTARTGGGSHSLDDTVALPRGSGGALPEQLLLLVDGGGSYLLLCGETASIGRAVSKSPAAIPIFSDLAERDAHINRVDDDYFLFSAREVEVGGRMQRQHLLHDGDRVVLGRQAKCTFRLPSRRSATAVIDLSDTTKMPNDVRRVVLFRHHATIGLGPGAHIQCRHANPPLVLFEREGVLWVRQKNDGHTSPEPRRLVLGEPMEIGGASIVLEKWNVKL